MSLNSKEHLFFVQEINEISLCGRKVVQFTGSDYCKPTDFIKIKYEKHNLETCEICKGNYAKVLAEITEEFKKFPTCCKLHKNLLNEKWFHKKDFENTPELYTNKLVYTWHHVLNFIETDSWQDEIVDFLEYIFNTFGSFPINYGEPLYFGRFIEQLESLIKGLTGFESRKKIILDYIHDYRNPPSNKITDWNILIKVYDDWYKTFPFELSYFSHLKEYFANNIPLIEITHTNKYLNLTKATPRSKESLINSLVEVTNKIISEINTVTLYEKGYLNDIEKVKLELILQKRKQKIGDVSINPDSKVS